MPMATIIDRNRPRTTTPSNWRRAAIRPAPGTRVPAMVSSTVSRKLRSGWRTDGSLLADADRGSSNRFQSGPGGGTAVDTSTPIPSRSISPIDGRLHCRRQTGATPVTAADWNARATQREGSCLEDGARSWTGSVGRAAHPLCLGPWAAGTLAQRSAPAGRALEGSPSPVYGARLLSGLRAQPSRGFKSRHLPHHQGERSGRASRLGRRNPEEGPLVSVSVSVVLTGRPQQPADAGCDLAPD